MTVLSLTTRFFLREEAGRRPSWVQRGPRNETGQSEAGGYVASLSAKPRLSEIEAIAYGQVESAQFRCNRDSKRGPEWTSFDAAEAEVNRDYRLFDQHGVAFRDDWHG